MNMNEYDLSNGETVLELNILLDMKTSQHGDTGLLPDTKKCGLCMRRECRDRSPTPQVNDPDMHR